VIVRELTREELADIWAIDRSEVVEHVYHLEEGQLVLRPERWDVRGWPQSGREMYTPILRDCFDRGGTFYGAFEGSELAGIVVLENQFIGRDRDQLQLKFMYVSRAYRKQGWGKVLFQKAVEKARAKGARRLYVSSTPSENTVNFYRHLGCVLAEEVDPELFALEPDDIHLEYVIPGVPVA
jgi:predicted N-acetyltransferase YhbS